MTNPSPKRPVSNQDVPPVSNTISQVVKPTPDESSKATVDGRASGAAAVKSYDSAAEGALVPAPDLALPLDIGTRFRIVGDASRRFSTYSVGSLREFTRKYLTPGQDLDAEIAKQRVTNPGQPEVWAIQECGVIVSDELAARGLRPTVPTVELAVGQVVEIEGGRFSLALSANNNAKFQPVPQVASEPISPAEASISAVDSTPVPKSWAIPTKAVVTNRMVADLLITAFEGGIGYWATVEKYVEPKSLGFRYDKEQVYRYADFPLNAGGAVHLRDEEGDEGPWILDAAAIKRGLEVMAEKYPSHFKNVINDNADAETGDVFVQCAVLGEIVYG